MSSTNSGIPSLSLFCLVVDNKNNVMHHLGVNATGDDLINSLKGRIYNKLGSVKEYLEPYQLTLWKVLQPVPAMYAYKDHERLNEFFGQFMDNPAIAQEMHPASRVSNYFSAIPTAGELHMVIQIPVPMVLVGRKRKRKESEFDDISLKLLERWQTPLPSLPPLELKAALFLFGMITLERSSQDAFMEFASFVITIKTTGNFRPDFGLLINRSCIFRGEEKQPTYLGSSPRDDLREYTRWVYDPTPYILGYYAVGTKITFVAMERHPAPRRSVVVRNILTTDLSTRRGRIDHLTKMIRLVSILCSLEKVVPKYADFDMFPDYLESGKTIDFFKYAIRKTYPLKNRNRVAFLQDIYKLLVENKYQIEGPKSVDDVKRAVICVLEALEVLHIEPKILHRDIRWPNVMRSNEDPRNWFLIDWEEATQEPTRATPNLRSRTHASQVFVDGHGTEVDIWGVGRLITAAGMYYLPDNLFSVGQKMMDGSIQSATQALEELRALED
ncbi:hypothetical protein AMATHDRAFT_42919 [Amanita thiersii Skay4041]|uniref:Protein kinase domain-containing protein n=1 Tax=Amanita thiersii Skay4041 TaxID=703135 RepID=A0A2A9NDS6_9AGAR|nr:hypothetical protein AMATHDRAFT_42919 [Amanita thiersii Skay4041]